MGDVMGDLNGRRGQIQGLEPRGNAQVVRAKVPLATMFGYVNDLRSATQGRATYTMHFDCYEAVPQVVHRRTQVEHGLNRPTPNESPETNSTKMEH